LQTVTSLPGEACTHYPWAKQSKLPPPPKIQTKQNGPPVSLTFETQHFSVLQANIFTNSTLIKISGQLTWPSTHMRLSSRSFHSTPVRNTRSSTGGWTMGPSVASFYEDQLHLHRNNNNNSYEVHKSLKELFMIFDPTRDAHCAKLMWPQCRLQGCLLRR